MAEKKYKVIVSDRAKQMLGIHIRFMAQVNKDAAIAKKKELIELKNQADSLAYQTKKTLDENKDKLDSNVVSEIESAVKELEDSAKSESTTKEELESKIKNLNDKAQVLAQAMQSNAQNAGNTQSAKKGKDDDVIDAEVE